LHIYQAGFIEKNLERSGGLLNKNEAHLVEVIYIFLNPSDLCFRKGHGERTSEFYAFAFGRSDIRIDTHARIAYIRGYAKMDIGGSGRETVRKGAHIDFSTMPSFVSGW